MSNKKEIRRRFKNICLIRDNITCRMCGLKAKSFEDAEKLFDVHHICDRSLMPNGGYVKENGITLCSDCHIKAEKFHSTGISYEGYSPDDLYKVIKSSLDLATKASNLLC